MTNKEIQLLRKQKENMDVLYDKRNSIEFETWRTKTIHLIERIYGRDSSHYSDFEKVRYTLSMAVIGTPQESYQRAYEKGLDTAKAYLQAYIEEAEEFEETSEQDEIDQSVNIESNKVFIVHGRDKLAKTEVARFLEKLGLEAVILSEQVNEGGTTLMEKLEKHTDVNFAVVLYTPCDVGALKEEKDDLKFRARQNVVFEHGYLIGKIGRKNVSALLKGNVETPNDISGVAYIPMNDDQGWQIQVAKELKAAGYRIDFNLLL